MTRFSLLLALMILCSDAGGVEAPRNLNDYPTDNPMRIVVVRSSRPGCEPDCAEWISAEGVIVLATPEQLRKILDSLRDRKLPILVHSAGGLAGKAMEMGFLIRARGLDVAVAKTVFESCANAPGGCKQGTWIGPVGEPSSHSAYCYSPCTFVLAGGVRRFVGPDAHVGVVNYKFNPAVVERWQKKYREKVPLGTVLQRSFVPPSLLMTGPTLESWEFLAI